ncbi:lactoylglutathione lyase [Streptococcus uberis]|uniref:lactoylglutathione lyase n=1 Tax=Streptococcus uberis TaxID=1349 RepID=UPI0005420442|nr:VOC family protein [Streptococcus uberis]KHD41347.1 lactoylglutathione lyase [Streptococcus hongkongensis]KKF42598.1 lactoylglutathione lyase [Streptococcus uberis C9359]KKF43611.1 lactoylglutathione lyase [Streptococcus uberis EF20/0145]KKF44619.1 lactoylglutathione lyase [Streptococcus uberis Ab71]KKF52624.1 lactoylglutathione lyase [Streptococcus uberis C5388]
MKALHTCIRVKNLEESLAFYTTAFPFKETRRRDFPDSKFTLVYLALEGEDYELELTYNYGHEAYDLGNGYGHIAIGSEDFQADYDKHVQAGYSVTDIKGLTDKSARYYFIQDPDGYKIEVIDLNR